jgi:hypothetical protein
MSRMLLGSASLDELLDRITDELKRLVPYDVLTVYRVDPVRSLLVPLHSVDLYAAEILDSPLPLGKGLTGWVVERRLAQNVPAAHLDRAGARHRERAGDDRGRAADGARPADRRAQRVPPG